MSLSSRETLRALPDGGISTNRLPLANESWTGEGGITSFSSLLPIGRVGGRGGAVLPIGLFMVVLLSLGWDAGSMCTNILDPLLFSGIDDGIWGPEAGGLKLALDYGFGFGYGIGSATLGPMLLGLRSKFVRSAWNPGVRFVGAMLSSSDGGSPVDGGATDQSGGCSNLLQPMGLHIGLLVNVDFALHPSAAQFGAISGHRWWRNLSTFVL